MNNRAIPNQMWEEIATQDAKTASIIGTSLAVQRLAIIRIGSKFGFTEAELQTVGLVAAPPPDRTAKPGDRKGGRSA